jgi:preprotein translocase subunit SecB
MSEEQGKNEVSINMQYINDMSLEVPHAPEIFAKITTPPQIGVDLNIDAQKLNDDQFEVTLNMRINAKVAEEPLFIFELSYAAACTVKIPDENKEPVLYIEIPRMLFPYARQIISSNLAEAGLPPLMLTPVDFAAVYKAKKEQQAASKVAN